MEVNNEQLDTLIQLNLLKENYNLLLEEEKFNLIQWFKDKLNSFVALAKSIPDKIRDMINKLKKNTSEVTEVETKEIEVAPGKKTKVSTSNFKSVCHNIMAGIANTGKNIANILQSLIKICKYAITRKNNEELQAEKKKLSDEVKQLKERFSILSVYRRAMGAIFNKKNAETSKDEDDPRARVQKQIDRGDKAIEDMKDLNKKAKENIAKHREFIDKRKKGSNDSKEKFEKSAKQPGSTLKSKQDIDNFFVGPNTSSEDFDKAMRNKNTRLTFK